MQEEMEVAVSKVRAAQRMITLVPGKVQCKGCCGMIAEQKREFVEKNNSSNLKSGGIFNQLCQVQ